MRELIGEKIHDLLVKRNITLECLSNDLGMSRQRLARIEKGQSDISLDILQKLAGVFGVTVGELTDVDDSPAVSFRGQESGTSSFGVVNEMIDFFFANKRLYDSFIEEEQDD